MSWRDLLILVLYALLTVALTWPLPQHIDETLIGDDYDVYVNLWANWWTREVVSEGLDFYHTDYIFYPRGTSLVFHSFSHTSTALWLLLTPLAGYFAAYNITILLAYILSGFAMYLLLHHLTGSRVAGLMAGLVFAFCPYHVFESAHPNLVSTQWIPFFALALHHVLYDTDANQVTQPLLGALWFLLAALSGWHLMLLLAGWTAVYVAYELLFNRADWAPAASRRLVVLAVVIALTMIPLVWPIIREYLTTDTTFVTVDVQGGLGNDLLSFFVPNRRHPLLSLFFAPVYGQIGYATRRPAYLGYVALSLAAGGAATAWRKTRSWLLAGLIFVLLSLGLRVKLSGMPLHAFSLPWAVPIVNLLRHPYRLNTLVFLSLAVLAGFGTHSLQRWAALRSRGLSYLIIPLAGAFLLFEYLAYPFPTMRPSCPPFIRQLAEEQGDFAVADFPMGRQPDKHYMFYQTIHEKKIVGGHVSRTPDDAYAFVAANPLLGALLAAKSPDPALDIRKQLTGLAAQGIRYIVLHRRFLDADELTAWRERLSGFPSPSYEDERLVAYRTLPSLEIGDLALDSQHRLDVHIGDHIRLLGYRLDAGDLSAGDALTATLYWRSDGGLRKDYHVFVHLVDEQGQLVAQHDGIPMWGKLPTWSWWKGEIIRDEHLLALDGTMPDGEYALYAGMYDPASKVRAPAVTSAGKRLAEDRVLLETISVTNSQSSREALWICAVVSETGLWCDLGFQS